MGDILEASEINNLLEMLEDISNRPPLTHIKPSQINHIENKEDREKWQKDFEIVNYLYVSPLERVLTSATNDKKTTCNYGDFSLIERMQFLKRILLYFGFTKEQILQLIPKNPQENEILIKAREKGFDYEVPCYNEERIKLATEFLQNREIKKEQMKKIVSNNI